MKSRDERAAYDKVSGVKREVDLSRINLKNVIITMLTGGAIVFFKTKKAYGFLPLIIAAGIGALLGGTGIVKTVFTRSLKDVTGWGLVQAQVLISSISHHGFLYYLAIIIYIYGLFTAIISIRENGEVPLLGIFIFLVYFFLMFTLINTKVTDRYNPINISVRLSNGIVDEILNLYGGVKAADYDNFKVMQQQINTEMVMHDITTGGYIPQPTLSKIADFVKQCEPSKKNIGALEIAIPKFDSVLQDYRYYDKETGKILNCAEVRQQLEQEVVGYVKKYLQKVASIRKVDYNQVKQTAIQEASMFLSTQIKAAVKGAIPSAWGSPDPYSDIAPSGSMSGVDLGLDEQDYLALYAFDANDLSSQVYNTLFDQSTGRTEGSGIFSSFIHRIIGGLKQFIGGFFVAVIDLIDSVLVPYVIYGFYMTNAIFFAFLEAFFPLVWVLNMGKVVNFKAIMKYIFVMIWVKSWVIPAVFLTQFYNFYMRKGFPSMASLIYIFLMFSIPSMMAIILLEGNAVLSKLDFGMTPKMALPILSGVIGSIASSTSSIGAKAGGAVSRTASSVGKTTSSPSSPPTSGSLPGGSDKDSGFPPIKA